MGTSQRGPPRQVLKLPPHRKAAQRGQRDIFHIKTLYFEQKFFATFTMAAKADSRAGSSRKGSSMEHVLDGSVHAKGSSRLQLVHGSKASIGTQLPGIAVGLEAGVTAETIDVYGPGRGLLSQPADALRREDVRNHVQGRPAVRSASQDIDTFQHPVRLTAELESSRRREQVLLAAIAQHQEVVRCAPLERHEEGLGSRPP